MQRSKLDDEELAYSANRTRANTQPSTVKLAGEHTTACALHLSAVTGLSQTALDLSVVLRMYDVGTRPVMPVCSSRHTLQPVSRRCVMNSASPLHTLSCTPSVASNECTASPRSATSVPTLAAADDTGDGLRAAAAAGEVMAAAVGAGRG